MSSLYPVTKTANLEVYKVGKFDFRAEDNDVIVTKDTKGGIISIGSYTYKNHEAACDAAWKMASRQKRA